MTFVLNCFYVIMNSHSLSKVQAVWIFFLSSNQDDFLTWFLNSPLGIHLNITATLLKRQQQRHNIIHPWLPVILFTWKISSTRDK